jgi:hypothetical protein
MVSSPEVMPTVNPKKLMTLARPGGRGVPMQRLATLEFALAKLPSKHAVGHRSLLHTSSGPISRADHTVIDTGHPGVQHGVGE